MPSRTFAEDATVQETYVTEFENVPLAVSFAWSAAQEYKEKTQHDFRLIGASVSIKRAADLTQQRQKQPKSAGIRDVVTAIVSQHMPDVADSWSGYIILVVTARSGYVAKSEIFQERFVGCDDLGLVLDRSVFGQYQSAVDGFSESLDKLLDSSVLMIIRSGQNDIQQYDWTELEEISARISFPWLLKSQPKEKTLVLVHGRDNFEAFYPIYVSAKALGIKLVVLDKPGHWLLDPSMRHMYHEFIPIDMTIDETFHMRIASTIKALGRVDGVCAVSDRCLLPVAKAASILGLPTESPEAVACAISKYDARQLEGTDSCATLVSDVLDLTKSINTESFTPQYPLIVKPTVGWGSEHVYKVTSEEELVEGVRRASTGSNKSVLIESYIDGPELDVNFILLDGEILFFEIADDFPSPGDSAADPLSNASDFWENINVLPSGLPPAEYNIVRETLHALLLRMGFRTGVFHLEARVQDSSMSYSTTPDEVFDLRLKPTSANSSLPPKTPRCCLIEVNPRPPGFPCVLATSGAYGVNMFGAHLLASLGPTEHSRLRVLAQPFVPTAGAGLTNHARLWSQIVFLKVEKGGICASEDACADLLRRFPDVAARTTQAMCFFRKGERVPEPTQGVVLFGAFFVVSSRQSREEVVRLAGVLQREFEIPTVEE